MKDPRCSSGAKSGGKGGTWPQQQTDRDLLGSSPSEHSSLRTNGMPSRQN